MLAGCDPAVRLLESEFARSGFRLLALTRASRRALDLLRDRLVHVAGVHLSGNGGGHGNEAAVREALGSGYRLLRLARWQEGIALAPSLSIRSVRAALRSSLRWVGREEGSGARRCLDRLLGSRPARGRAGPRLASDHRSVAEAIRSGWAQAGVCVRLCAEEAGLGFLRVEVEDYDLCYPQDLEGDPRLAALISAVRSSAYRRVLRDLQGYDAATAGEIHEVE